MLELVKSLQHFENLIFTPATPLKKYHLLTFFWAAEAYVVLWVIRVRLKFSGMAWLKNQLTFASERVAIKSSIQDSERLLTLKESVRLASRLHAKSTQCLPRSLTLKRMLERRGEQSRTVIGVAKSEEGAFASHAWVEVFVNQQWCILGEPEHTGDLFSRLSR